MKHPYLFAGALALAVLLVGSTGIGIIVYRSLTLEKESIAFIETSARAIAEHWDDRQLLDRATRELRANVTPQELASMFGDLAPLGAPVGYQASKGAFNIDLSTQYFLRVTAIGGALIRCERGTVELKLGVLYRDGHWMIDDFRYDIDPVTAESVQQRR